MSATMGSHRRFGAVRDVFGGITAIGVKELRGRMRGRRAFVILTIHLLLVAGFAWMIESLMEQTFTGNFGSAFTASSEEARAPVCEEAALLPAVVLPDLTAMIGLRRPMRLAIRENLAGLPKDSR